MVWGTNAAGQADIHRAAMHERDRKDFHWQFTTLRFRPLAEYGIWNGCSSYVPRASTATIGG